MSHAAIEKSPYGSTAAAEQKGQSAAGPALLVLSAPQQKRLASQVGMLEAWLWGAGKTEHVKAIANTLALRRAQHDYRAAFVESHDLAGKMLMPFAMWNTTESSRQLHDVTLRPSSNTDLV